MISRRRQPSLCDGRRPHRARLEYPLCGGEAQLAGEIRPYPGRCPTSRAATALGWLAILAFAGCTKSPDACERLAARLMPNPDATFIETCRAERAHDASYARMVDCVLAIEGGVTETELKACPGSDRLLFFQF
jgi:hypothetical protein